MSVFSQVSRRGFLKLAGAATASAVLPLRALGDSPNERVYDDGNRAIPIGATGNVESVIVIGAGFAGLAAANALANAGIGVTVLEARARVGGRAHTVSVGSTAVDLGCAYIHNPGAMNAMSRLVTQTAGNTIPVNFTFLDRLSLYDAVLARGLTGAESLAVFGHLAGFENSLLNLLALLGPQATMLEAIHHYLDAAGVNGDLRRQVESAATTVVEQSESGAVSTVGLRNFATLPYKHFAPGREDVFPRGGYSPLAEALGSGLDIRFGQDVRTVAYDSGGVTVETAANETYHASHVVVAVPLGVLKAGASSLAFTPALPAAKQSAINALGFGNFEKVVLRFPEAFWRGSRSHFLYFSETPQEYPLWYDYDAIDDAPVLTVWSAGSFAQSIAASSQSQVFSDVRNVLTNVFGTIPEPQEMLVTSWTNDPYTRGAYSYFALGADGGEMEVLSEPVGGRVLFAGEATNTARYATADGAFASGIREAKRLLGARHVKIGTPPTSAALLPPSSTALASLQERIRRKVAANVG